MADVKVVEITAKRKEELEKELEWRKNTERDRILTAISEARAQGDLSENADYSSARDAQSKNEAAIAELEETLKHVKIIQATRIKVKYVALKETAEYLVSGSESNPFEGKISAESPLAKAVIGHKAGDTVYMTTENGKDVEIKILEID
ncbi:MAG: GreA/GreB family elongation factor [Acholeplasmatales bacterium]|jgi:transcription elongation factor GreA|nr:GreA/GreB family elongation factor [Acholeplasmatales bacterium]